MGAHKRWCIKIVGPLASHYGPMSERLHSMGDSVGPNNMELSSKLWALSVEMREFALLKRREHEQRESDKRELL